MIEHFSRKSKQLADDLRTVQSENLILYVSS